MGWSRAEPLSDARNAPASQGTTSIDEVEFQADVTCTDDLATGVSGATVRIGAMTMGDLSR
jgi:hypothetical protein